MVNRIKVIPPRLRIDAEIEKDIEEALLFNAATETYEVDVDVQNSEATLSGTVDSWQEKMAAEKGAMGVRGLVAVNNKIDWWALNEEDLRRDEFMVKSDVDIRHALKDALLYDPQVSSFNIELHVNAGAVTLRGEVNNLKAKRAAARDASDTVGVLRVRNRIKVRPEAEISDQQIEDNVRAALIRDPYLHGLDIKIRVYDNTVYLNGDVVSFHQKAHADEIAAGIRGVKTVKNHLTVHHAHLPYIAKPYIDEGAISDYNWYDYRPGYRLKQDAEIKAEIQEELFWSPFVDSDNIEVSVQNGIATLSGRVDSPAEKSMAEANAFEGGATRVVNNLKLKR